MRNALLSRVSFALLGGVALLAGCRSHHHDDPVVYDRYPSVYDRPTYAYRDYPYEYYDERYPWRPGFYEGGRLYRVDPHDLHPQARYYSRDADREWHRDHDASRARNWSDSRTPRESRDRNDSHDPSDARQFEGHGRVVPDDRRR